MFNIEPYKSNIQFDINEAGNRLAGNVEDRMSPTLLDSIISGIDNITNNAHKFVVSILQSLSEAVMCLVNKVKSMAVNLFGISESEKQYLIELERKKVSVIILSKALEIDLEDEALEDQETIKNKYEEIQELMNTPETEEALKSLKTLDLGGLDLKFLPENVFDGFEGLTNLKLTENNLETIPEGIFDKFEKLETLILSDNKLKELPEKVFDKLENMILLSLNHNRLEELPGAIFDKVENLLVLSLSHNRLKELPDAIFDNLDSLHFVCIQSNPLSDQARAYLSRFQERFPERRVSA